VVISKLEKNGFKNPTQWFLILAADWNHLKSSQKKKANKTSDQLNQNLWGCCSLLSFLAPQVIS
jgi:hypothetical protein